MLDDELKAEDHSDMHTIAKISLVTSISQGAREYQEDAMGHWLDSSAQKLFAVIADGAGGHGGGAEASQAAIAAASEAWQKITANQPHSPQDFLAQWMADAHHAVNVASEKIQQSARSVVVACFADGNAVHWVHAGDCRLLRFHHGKLVERTRDDSVVQVLFERGEITEEEMGNHPDQSRLLQSLGGAEAPTPRLGRADLIPGDVLILCSDGFWEHLKQSELEKIAAMPAKKRQQALDQAVTEAVKRGGAKADNTTAMIIAFDGPESPRVATFWYTLVFLVALVVYALILQRNGKLGNLKQIWEKWRLPTSACSEIAPSSKPSTKALYE